MDFAFRVGMTGKTTISTTLCLFLFWCRRPTYIRKRVNYSTCWERLVFPIFVCPCNMLDKICRGNSYGTFRQKFRNCTRRPRPTHQIWLQWTMTQLSRPTAAAAIMVTKCCQFFQLHNAAPLSAQERSANATCNRSLNELVTAFTRTRWVKFLSSGMRATAFYKVSRSHGVQKITERVFLITEPLNVTPTQDGGHRHETNHKKTKHGWWKESW